MFDGLAVFASLCLPNLFKERTVNSSANVVLKEELCRCIESESNLSALFLVVKQEILSHSNYSIITSIGPW